MLPISILQFLWLNSRGGRTLDDVVVQNNKLGIMLRANGHDEFMEIPSDKDILREYNVVQSIKPRYHGYISHHELVLRGKY